MCGLELGVIVWTLKNWTRKRGKKEVGSRGLWETLLLVAGNLFDSFILHCFTFEDVTDRLSRNVRN
jgi:hypothetical protein